MRSKHYVRQLKVTDEELFIARRGVNTRCAIAAAIMMQVPSSRRIKVNRAEISWLDVDLNRRFVYRTPPQARQFVERWDANEKVEPFTFTLTDNFLVAVREPKVRSAAYRCQAPLRAKPTKRPGLLMNRRADEECETPAGG